MIVDAPNRTLRDVAVLTVGQTVDGRFIVDEESLRTALKVMQEWGPEGVPSLDRHDGEALNILGRLVNPRIDHSSLRADLEFLETFEDGDRLLEIASKMPRAFGLSLCCTHEKNKNLRVTGITSIDLAQVPAANPRGLLSAEIPANKNPESDEPSPSMNPDEIKSLLQEVIAPLSARLEAMEKGYADMSAKLEAMKPAEVSLESDAPDPDLDTDAPEPVTKEVIEEMVEAKLAKLSAEIQALPDTIRSKLGAAPVRAVAPSSTAPDGELEFEALVLKAQTENSNLSRADAIDQTVAKHPQAFLKARQRGIKL